MFKSKSAYKVFLEKFHNQNFSLQWDKLISAQCTITNKVFLIMVHLGFIVPILQRSYCKGAWFLWC